MSAQTTDAQVNKVTPGLFALARTPAEMAALGSQRILAAIESCGLAPTKAKNIHRLSQILVERHGGEVPDTLAELEALPGVGHKTASVVLSQAFGKPAFPVDTHIHRLAARWGLSSGKNVVQTERDLKRLFPEPSWARLHLQIIYFGREHCPALGHDLASCPICGWAATKKRIAEEARRRRLDKRT
jgi:endonuclease-3